MRIGVISDTHIPGRARAIPETVLQAFAGVDLIFHAGDLVVPEVLAVLETVAPVEAVLGNNDRGLELPVSRIVTAGRFRIGLTHGHLGIGRTTVARALSHFDDVDCVVFGHSHIPHCERHGTVLAFNPGSATDRRRMPRCSFGMLFIEPDELRAEVRFVE